jgi:hypothetical protein
LTFKGSIVWTEKKNNYHKYCGLEVFFSDDDLSMIFGHFGLELEF